MEKIQKIAFQNVSKKFSLNRNARLGLRQILSSFFLRKKAQTQEEPFWALKEVNFELNQGECLGVVGANGAGKTTMLKLIANILTPDEGLIKIHGKIGALIELGAGFHPELTGRENIFLYGTILGMKRKEIKRCFDELVDFSGLKDFLDVPIKRYSTGMYARLGFSVAIFTQPEILLVDEVLAVGDAAFQTRCMRRLSDMKKRGVGILFVSHDMAKVQQVSDRCLWLNKGKIEAIGDVSTTIGAYLQYFDKEEGIYRKSHETSEDQTKISGVSITKIQLLNAQLQDQRLFEHGESLTVRVSFQTDKIIEAANFSVSFEAMNGELYTGCSTKWDKVNFRSLKGSGFIDLIIPYIILGAGTYEINVGIWDQDFINAYDWKWGVCQFAIKSSVPMLGRFIIPHQWQSNFNQNSS